MQEINKQVKETMVGNYTSFYSCHSSREMKHRDGVVLAMDKKTIILVNNWKAVCEQIVIVILPVLQQRMHDSNLLCTDRNSNNRREVWV